MALKQVGTLLSNHVAKGIIAVRHIDLDGLCQSLNCSVPSEDP